MVWPQISTMVGTQVFSIAKCALVGYPGEDDTVQRKSSCIPGVHIARRYGLGSSGSLLSSCIGILLGHNKA